MIAVRGEAVWRTGRKSEINNQQKKHVSEGNMLFSSLQEGGARGKFYSLA
ncbi:hypothetical protein Bbad01_19400 [Bacillus badius]|nr:hypothetical protein Bbad01_19400 [Bacillus badius]